MPAKAKDPSPLPDQIKAHKVMIWTFSIIAVFCLAMTSLTAEPIFTWSRYNAWSKGTVTSVTHSTHHSGTGKRRRTTRRSSGIFVFEAEGVTISHRFSVRGTIPEGAQYSVRYDPEHPHACFVQGLEDSGIPATLLLVGGALFSAAAAVISARKLKQKQLLLDHPELMPISSKNCKSSNSM